MARTIAEARVKNQQGIGAESVLMRLGLMSPVISRNEAVKAYGAWFVRLLNEGRILPVRKGEGRTGTYYFSVAEIRKALTDDLAVENVTRDELRNF